MGAELIHTDSRSDSRIDMTTLIGVSLRITRTRKESRGEEIWRKYRHMSFLLTSREGRTKPIISRTFPQVAHLNYSFILKLFKDTVLAKWIQPKVLRDTVITVNVKGFESRLSWRIGRYSSNETGNCEYLRLDYHAATKWIECLRI
jgi:hypothetical protein